MKKNTGLLIFDGFILLVIAAIIAGGFMLALSPLKKGKDADPLVTAINQENLERTQKVLSEDAYQKLKAKKKPVTFQDYIKERTAKKDESGRTPLMWLAYVNYRDKNADDLESSFLMRQWNRLMSALTGDKNYGKTIKVKSDENKENTDRRTKADEKRLPIIEVLVTAGADVNAKDNDGWTALIWASWSGMPKVTEKLLDLKADITVVDRKGNSALTMAAMRGNLDVVKILIAKGAKPAATDKAVIEKAMKEYPKKKATYEQILGLLGTGPAGVPGCATEAAATPAKETAPVPNTLKHTVLAGENIQDIATLYNTTVQKILDLNKDTLKSAADLKEGSVILVSIDALK